MPVQWYQRAGDQAPGRRLGLRIVVALGIILLFAVLVVLSAPWWLPGIARALFYDEPPVSADAILVLGGGEGSRQDRAIALYQAGYAPIIISSGEKPYLPGVERSYAELGADYMVAHGVPPEAILLMPQTTSTYDEAIFSLQLAQELGYASLLVVTDHYHTRRAALTFKRAYRGSSISCTIVAAQPEWFQVDAWWRAERPLLAVFEEYEKTIFYLLSGYIP